MPTLEEIEKALMDGGESRAKAISAMIHCHEGHFIEHFQLPKFDGRFEERCGKISRKLQRCEDGGHNFERCRWNLNYRFI
jgi:hypothetical protein